MICVFENLNIFFQNICIFVSVHKYFLYNYATVLNGLDYHFWDTFHSSLLHSGEYAHSERIVNLFVSYKC